jgi:hypothetical protein
MHPARQREPIGFDHQMKVIVHQTEDVTEPAEPSDDIEEEADEGATVDVVAHDRDLPGSARSDVIDAVWKKVAWLSRHDPSVDTRYRKEPRRRDLDTDSAR